MKTIDELQKEKKHLEEHLEAGKNILVLEELNWTRKRIKEIDDELKSRSKKEVQSWLDKPCCICGKEVRSMYSYHQHMGNGKLRIYSGHKRCLFLVPDRLEKGEEVEYEEIDVPIINKG